MAVYTTRRTYLGETFPGRAVETFSRGARGLPAFSVRRHTRAPPANVRDRRETRNLASLVSTIRARSSQGRVRRRRPKVRGGIYERTKKKTEAGRPTTNTNRNARPVSNDLRVFDAAVAAGLMEKDTRHEPRARKHIIRVRLTITTVRFSRVFIALRFRSCSFVSRKKTQIRARATFRASDEYYLRVPYSTGSQNRVADKSS